MFKKYAEIIEFEYKAGNRRAMTTLKTRTIQKLIKNKVFKGSSFEAIVQIGKIKTKIDIRIFLQKSLDIKNITQKRVIIVQNSIPEYKIEVIKNSNNVFIFDLKGKKVKKWINELKEKI